MKILRSCARFEEAFFEECKFVALVFGRKSHFQQTLLRETYGTLLGHGCRVISLYPENWFKDSTVRKPPWYFMLLKKEALDNFKSKCRDAYHLHEGLQTMIVDSASGQIKCSHVTLYDARDRP